MVKWIAHFLKIGCVTTTLTGKMATRSSTALEELDEQLTCNVCLDQYTNPKTLPCLHSFCLKCIEKLPQEPQVHTHTHTHLLDIQSDFVYTSLFIHYLIC